MNKSTILNYLKLVLIVAIFARVIYFNYNQNEPNSVVLTETEALLSGQLVDAPCGGEHGGQCKDLEVNVSANNTKYSAVLSHESIYWLKQYMQVEEVIGTDKQLKIRFNTDKTAFKISEVNNKKVVEPAPWFYIKN